MVSYIKFILKRQTIKLSKYHKKSYESCDVISLLYVETQSQLSCLQEILCSKLVMAWKYSKRDPIKYFYPRGLGPRVEAMVWFLTLPWQLMTVYTVPGDLISSSDLQGHSTYMVHIYMLPKHLCILPFNI